MRLPLRKRKKKKVITSGTVKVKAARALWTRISSSRGLVPLRARRRKSPTSTERDSLL